MILFRKFTTNEWRLNGKHMCVYDIHVTAGSQRHQVQLDTLSHLHWILDMYILKKRRII